MLTSTSADVADRENAFRIAIKLDVPEIPEEEAPVFLLQVAYPEDYPDVAPDLDLQTAPDGPRHPLLDLASEKDGLLESIQPTIEESLGMSMVFSIHAALKEKAENLISERLAKAEAEREATIREAEEKENAKFHGTTVTRETFIEWRDRFVKEMEEKEEREIAEKEAEDRKKRGGKDEKKLTGRQLWERGLVGKVDIDDGVEGDDAIATGISKVEVSG